MNLKGYDAYLAREVERHMESGPDPFGWTVAEVELDRDGTQVLVSVMVGDNEATVVGGEDLFKYPVGSKVTLTEAEHDKAEEMAVEEMYEQEEYNKEMIDEDWGDDNDDE